MSEINGAAMLAERYKPCITSQSADKAGDATIAGSNPAAAPPVPTPASHTCSCIECVGYGVEDEPTPADSERGNLQATDSHESPAAEREGEAWVPGVNHG